jgi:phospholipid transport system substrate-binding protein
MKMPMKCFLVLVVFLSRTFLLSAGEAMQQLEKSVTEIIAVLNDPALKLEDKKDEREKKMGSMLESRFNYIEMSRKTLGKEWKNINENQQKEFSELFSKLLKNTYIKKIEGYTDEKVTYIKEIELDQEKVVVQTMLHSKKGDIPIDYSMHQTGKDWEIYDVTIEGVGLLKNYRTQFKEILEKESFDSLIKKLKEKNEKNET